jgi:hypothetical protein
VQQKYTARRWYWFLALSFLGGCDSQSMEFMAARSENVVIGGMNFGVHWTDKATEVYRTGMIARRQWDDVPANALLAIETVTGCKVKEGSMEGDAALMKAKLTCPAT